MALKHYLKMFPMPGHTGCYLGLFRNFKDRTRSDKPNKCLHGVSYTKFADAMDIRTGDMTLFDMFHGSCYIFALYFASRNPGWKIRSVMRWKGSVRAYHCFCTRKAGGITYFADARGITDDPCVFFDDYKCSKDAYLITEKYKGELDDVEETPETKAASAAYDLMIAECAKQDGKTVSRLIHARGEMKLAG